MFGWRSHARQAGATVTAVVMLDRPKYGIGVFRVTYAVAPLDEPSFTVTIEVHDVALGHMPQAGQQITVRYDPGNHEHFEVLTAPGAETGTVTTPTLLIPWDEFARPSGVWADGSRRS
jgi:hypothetical protein